MSIKRKPINVRFDEETIKRIEEISVEENISNSAVVRNIVDEVLNPEITNTFEFLDDGCELRDYLAEHEVPIGKKYSEGFYCLKKAPSLIRLGSGVESAASKICSKCKIRDEAIADSRVLNIIKREGIKIEMPICSNGGHPNEDLTEMYCPIIGRNRPIKEKKKKKDYVPCRLGGGNNARCKHLSHKIIVTGLKEKDNR